MNLSKIESFAVEARKDLINQITTQALKFGISKDKITPEQLVEGGAIINDHILNVQQLRQRKDLINAIQEKGLDTVIEEVAYTWFNRLTALRYMEVNNLLGHPYRLFSSSSNLNEPDILVYANEISNHFIIKPSIIAQYRLDKDEEGLYRLLIIKQCQKLSSSMPQLFEGLSSYKELLLPSNLLSKNSFIHKLVNGIDEADFKDISILGWLYQYYISEKKDQIYAAKKKRTKEEIPAVTALFTPKWIVKYMVQNSLGKLWLEGHPNLKLQESFEYYLEEAEQFEEVENKLEKIRQESSELAATDISFLEPCCGSGHILIEAFDVFYEIYISQGYYYEDIPELILKNNLIGLDIDDRSVQLATFALTMKALEKDKNFLEKGVSPRIYGFFDAPQLNSETIDIVANDASLDENIIHYLLETFKEAKTIGSLLKVREYNYFEEKNKLETTLQSQGNLDLIEANFLLDLYNLADILSNKYDVVVTNPPYMGTRSMNSILVSYLNKNYSDSKMDLFSAFIEKCIDLSKNNGFISMITMQSWMFLSSYEKLRKKLAFKEIVNMAHLGPRAFEEIGGEVVQTTSFAMRNSYTKGYKGTYARLIEPSSQKGKEEMFLKGENRYIANQDNFEKMPNHVYSYWFNKFYIFENGKMLKDIANPRQGMKTLKNDYFIRNWYEVDSYKIFYTAKSLEEAKNSECKYFPINHGGEYRKYYGNNFAVVNWLNDGEEMKNLAIKKYNSITRTITNLSSYFKEGLTWSVITSKPSFRWYNIGYMFTNSGQCIVPNEPIDLMYIAGLLNSKIISYVLELLSPGMGFESGYLKKIPILYIPEKANFVKENVWNSISLSKLDWDMHETSWDFKKNPLI